MHDIYNVQSNTSDTISIEIYVAVALLRDSGREREGSGD